MERTVEPELMEREDQVDSYAKADFSEGENNLISQINHYLIKNNIQGVIYANQMIRASHKSMFDTAKSILKSKRSFEAGKKISKIQTILDLFNERN